MISVYVKKNYRNMDDYLLQFLKDLDQQIKENTPNIMNAMNEFINSPVMIEARELANKAKETIPGALQQFAELTEQYRLPFLDNLKNVMPALQQFARAAGTASVAYYLGVEQFVWWKIPSREVIEAVTANAQNERVRKTILEDWIQEYDPDETIQKLKANEHLSENLVFLQSLAAYENGNYDIAALGITACFDKMLSICSGKPTHKIEERVKKLTERLENTEEDKLNLSEDDYDDYYLLVSYQLAAENFNKSSPFTDPEPLELNRHWIMHGRTEKKMTKMDCFKLINLLYGTILMAEMAGEET